MCCMQCDTSIDTKLPIPSMLQLPADLQEFVMIFLRCEGKIRDVEKELGISYPTVIKRLNLVNVLLGNVPPGGVSSGAPGAEEATAEGETLEAVAKERERGAKGTPTSRRLTRKDVLEQLERGEITFQQATQLLKAQ